MCGICGYMNNKEKVTTDNIILEMSKTINRRGPDAINTYIDKHVALGHTRLSIRDILYGNQPMKKEINGTTYVITYNGELYNYDEMRKIIESEGYILETKCDTEVILLSYIIYGKECLNLLDGIFAFCIYCSKNDNIFLARDRLGIKPLFYTIQNNTLIFGSEIKAILKHPLATAIISEREVMELLALGPAHNPGNTYFKNIYELEAGYYATFDGINFNTYKYWDLETKDYTDSVTDAIQNVKELVTKALNKQLVSDVPICSMLSGGLDSSVLTYLAKKELGVLSTFSIDFSDNKDSFVSNSYQPTQDSEYVKIMSDFLNTKHKQIYFGNSDLYNLLEESMICRDMPGMADIDSSMLAFCRKINESGFKVAISGECSDEIFGGYPWYYRDKLIRYDSFPWALSDNIREKIITPNISNMYSVKSYIKESYDNTVNNVVFNTSDDFENKFRKTNYLTIKWFMNTLVERTDRTSMCSGLEVRVPFAYHKIFEYVYNLPAKYKLGLIDSYEPIEKYLLRKAFEGDLPKSIIYRKKSPFPKTYSRDYLSLVKNKITEILKDHNSPLCRIINREYINEILDTDGNILTENWFGQLMTYPQTLAYLIQINMWLEKYNPRIEF